MIDNYRKYYEKIMNDPLPPLEEDERIYLNVSYKARGFVKATNCRFDSIKKLWFTGVHNTFIFQLVELYGVNKETSEKAMTLLKDKNDSRKQLSNLRKTEILIYSYVKQVKI